MQLKALLVCALAATLALLMAAGASDLAPVLLELDRGEAAPVRLANGAQRAVRLLDCREHTEPYYESANKQIVQAVVSADVTVDVDGVTRKITGGPFRMPVAVNGVSLLVACTQGWTGGIDPDALAKDVRLEASDASKPWYSNERVVFPVRNYRWHAMNYQHTYLGLAVNQAKLYYHRGEDFGMIPDLEQALAITDAVVTTVPGPGGDGDSNYVVLEGSAGLRFLYAHMNATHIRKDLQPGSRVACGEVLGLTGNTWAGHPVIDPHLHVEATGKLAGRKIDTFPLIAAAYRTSFPDELLPVAGGWRHASAGDSITLDGSLSQAADGTELVGFDWRFSDGTGAHGPSVTKRYNEPGAYSEQLTITDDQGRSDSDFVEVFVLSPGQKTAPPYAWINYYPVRGIRPGTDVRFLTRCSSLRNLSIDYGDGVSEPSAESTTHSYQRRGTYVVTVRGESAGAGPGVFRVRVIVE
jgi:PKD domain/Peptidase family M23